MLKWLTQMEIKLQANIYEVIIDALNTIFPEYILIKLY
jgi:hypothetical protein